MEALNKSLEKIQNYNRLCTLFLAFGVIFFSFSLLILSTLNIGMTISILFLLPITIILFSIAFLFSNKGDKEVESLKQQYKQIKVKEYMAKKLINLVVKDVTFLRGPEFGDKNEGILILVILSDKTIKKEYLSKEMFEKTFL